MLFDLISTYFQQGPYIGQALRSHTAQARQTTTPQQMEQYRLCLILLVMAAVALFVYTGFQNAPYEFLEKNEDFELEYGVAGMVREKQKAYRKDYVLGMVISVYLCVISPVPLLLGSFGGIGFQVVALLCVTMGIVGCGVYGLVRNGVRWASMQKLLQEG